MALADDRRRRVVAWLALAPAVPATALADAPQAPIAQPAVPGPRAWAGRALALRDEAVRRGDQPYGAVVVRDGVIVGEGVSAVVARAGPAAHAERLAIADALRRSGARELVGASLYGSSPACSACRTAARDARIARLYHGADAVDDGAPA